MRRLTRTQAIDALRQALLALSDDEHSVCELAGRLGIFCDGFAQWTFGELKRRHPQIVRSRRRVTPAELRELADRWQLARQTALGTTIACDTQMLEDPSKRTCQGWNEFDERDLARFHAELCGEEVEVVPDPAP